VRIAEVSFEPLRMAMVRPLVTSRGVLHERIGFRLAIASESGERGIGEASPTYWLGDEVPGDTRRSLEAIVRHARECKGIEHLAEPDFLRCLTPAAAFALETALADVEARQAKVPVAKLLGAGRISSISICALLTGSDPDSAREEAASAVARGFRCLKIKLGARSIEGDESIVGAVRAIVGDRIALRLDANRAWSFEDAAEAIRRLDPFAIEFIEEPLASPEPAALAELRNAARVPVALDESIDSLETLEKFAHAQAADVIVLKGARIGGLARAATIGGAAARFGMKVVVTDSIESEIGMAAAVHLAAAVATPSLAIGLGGASLLKDHRLAGGGPITSVRPAPGLDVERGEADA
jgi:o-succinylbenzoate synthase